MWTRTFWRDAAERAVATAAEAALALVAADGMGVLEVDWAHVGSVSGLAAVAAVLKALVASRTGDPSSASLVDLPGKHAAEGR